MARFGWTNSSEVDVPASDFLDEEEVDEGVELFKSSPFLSREGHVAKPRVSHN